MTSSAHLLLVDDEANIRLTLGTMLQRAGYEVSTASSGAEALALLEQRTFDLMLVDLKMPGMDGMQVVAASRNIQPDLTVIVLTGQGSLDTAVEGIRYNIFDYLLKTTEPQRVLERIRAGLSMHAQERRRRELLETMSAVMQELRDGGAPGVPAPAYTPAPGTPTPSANLPPELAANNQSERLVSVGLLQLDTWRQVASLNGRTLTLTPTEFRVLLCLAEHVGTMLSYGQLVKCAQGYDTSEAEAGELIKPHIHHLRQKLEPDPSSPRYILNVRGKGYLLSMAGE
jgi:DNA-binding response OmpR family regulator